MNGKEVKKSKTKKTATKKAAKKERTGRPVNPAVSFRGKALEKLMKKHDLKQSELAAMVGISPAMLSQIRNTNKGMSVATLERFALAFNMPLHRVIRYFATGGRE